MAQASSMKQLGARNLGFVVERMEWNHKMDLIAIGNNKGEVIIQRLNWQKIVTFPAHSDNVFVRSLSWQIDEPILAVGYSDGKVSLFDAEREEMLVSFSYDGDLTNAYFSKPINVTDYKSPYKHDQELSHELFLPPLPALNNSSQKQSSHDLKCFPKNSTSFLVVITTSGKVHLLLLGALKAGTIDITQYIDNPDSFYLYDVRLSGASNAAFVLLRDGNQLRILHLHNKLLDTYMSPLLDLAKQCSNILETKSYLNNTIQCMMENWETLLMEMDNKLTKYTNQQPEDHISADFLELLLFGYASEEIEDFLIQELTEKGIKKLANSVNVSCSALQNLVSKPLQSAGVSLLSYLNSIKGMARIPYFFEPLLSLHVAEEAERSAGAFLLKAFEMQQVVDHCISDLKSFICWICSAILRLLQREEEIIPMNPEDTNNLAEYLNSFEDKVIQHEDGTVTKRKFNLEKIGQYFEDRNLQQIIKTDESQLWDKLLEENECLRNCQFLYPHDKSASLIQQQNAVLQYIDEIFVKSSESVSQSFTLDANIVCCQLPEEVIKSNGDYSKDYIRCSYRYNEKTQTDLLLTTIDWKECLILICTKDFTNLQCIRVHLDPGPFTSTSLNCSLSSLVFMDTKFYNENVISMLVQQRVTTTHHQDSSSSNPPANGDAENSSYFVQLCLDIVKDKKTQHFMPQSLNLYEVSVAHSIHDIIDSSYFKQVDANSTHLAVSGSRKVASILSTNCVKMTMFEMEIEDDEDETEMSQNSLLEISKESITMSPNE